MKKILMTLLATAVAVPMMFAADAPKTDTKAPATKTAKKKHHSKKKTAGNTTTPAATPAK
jgi:Ni/Co efflux regulator RcnB